MRRLTAALVLIATLAISWGTLACGDDSDMPASSLIPLEGAKAVRVELPEPRYVGPVSLEESLVNRRSIRDYTAEPLTLEEVSQLLWAAQGITSDWGGRTAPSAGGLYPLEVHVVVGNVQQLAAGIYRYDPRTHELVMTAEGDVRAPLSVAVLDQTPVNDGAINLIFTAVYQRTTQKYGDRGIRYVHMEAGHASQNVYLQVVALGLGTVTIGAFYEDEVSRLLGLPEDEEPLYVMPVGRPL